MKDPCLARWSSILFGFAILTAAISFYAPLTILWQDQPILLAKGTEIWKSTIYTLPKLDAAMIIAISLLPQAPWLYGLYQIMRLARNYRQGKIFSRTNSAYFIKLGYAIFVMGLISALIYPILNMLLFYRGISPWLGDMDTMTFIQPDLLMAGIFFLVIGKIMQRGTELEETDQLTV